MNIPLDNAHQLEQRATEDGGLAIFVWEALGGNGARLLVTSTYVEHGEVRERLSRLLVDILDPVWRGDTRAHRMPPPAKKGPSTHGTGEGNCGYACET